MTDTNNGWPDKPGVPMNPEKDGSHWIYSEVGRVPALWNAKTCCWQMIGNDELIEPGELAEWGWRYLSPCLTPAEVAALQKRADQSALGYAREARKADLFKFMHKRDVAALQARIAELEAALKDMAKYIWRDDYQKLEPTTRAALGDKK